MANAEKLRETVQAIRDNQDRWDQDLWVQGRVNPDATHYTECNTTLCFAGWRCLLDGLRPTYNSETKAATGYFYDPANPDMELSPSRVAVKSLDLNWLERDLLFYNFTSDVDVLSSRVEAVIAGDYSFEGNK